MQKQQVHLLLMQKKLKLKQIKQVEELMSYNFGHEFCYIIFQFLPPSVAGFHSITSCFKKYSKNPYFRIFTPSFCAFALTPPYCCSLPFNPSLPLTPFAPGTRISGPVWFCSPLLWPLPSSFFPP